MSVKGWNFKLLIVAWHGFEGGRRVRLPSSAPSVSMARLQISSVVVFSCFADTCSITWFFTWLY